MNTVNEAHLRHPVDLGSTRADFQLWDDAPMAEGSVPDGATSFQKSLGLLWSHSSDDSGSVTIEMDIRDDLLGPAGSLEGGVVSTIIDVAGASAIAIQAGLVATEHMAVSFLAPGRIGPIRAIGTPLRVGTHDGVADVRVVDVGKDGRLMAVGQVTVRILGELRAPEA